jgi:hypothetical protein
VSSSRSRNSKMDHLGNQIAPPRASVPSRPRKVLCRPVDAEDLRRRLYIVLSERSAAEDGGYVRTRTKAAARVRGEHRRAEQGLEVPKVEVPKAEAPKLEVPKVDDAPVAMPTAHNATSITAEAERAGPEVVAQTPPKATQIKPSRYRLEKSLSKSERDKYRSLHSEPSTQEPAEKYHHVPQEAADQFVKTATPDNVKVKPRVSGLTNGLTNGLTLQPSRLYLTGFSAEDFGLDPSTTLMDETPTLERTESHQLRMQEREKLQQSRLLERTAETHWMRDPRKRYSMPTSASTATTFNTRMTTERTSSISSNGSSLGYVWEAREHKPPRPVTMIMAGPGAVIPEHDVLEPTARERVDWTQSDEMEEKRKSMRSPFLRKADSMWSLKEKFGLTRHGRGGEGGRFETLSEKIGSVVTVKPLRLGLFARFKRQL